MSDRSDEVTKRREPGSTDDLLEETERLLSGDGSSSTREESTARDAEETAEGSQKSQRSRRTATEYFSPKAFLAFVLVLGAGVLAGSMVIPLVGAQAGLLAVAFLGGLLTAKRRYSELLAGSAAVGGGAAVLGDTLPIAAGSSQTALALGAGVAVVVCLLGYYFGRDLRDGLAREV